MTQALAAPASERAGVSGRSKGTVRCRVSPGILGRGALRRSPASGCIAETRFRLPRIEDHMKEIRAVPRDNRQAEVYGDGFDLAVQDR